MRRSQRFSSALQERGSPGAFWESEQESLLFVIEMKSERVQEQNRKLQQMNQLVRFCSPSCAPNRLVLTSASCFPDGEEPDSGGPAGPRPAAERGPDGAGRQLPEPHSVRSVFVLGVSGSPAGQEVLASSSSGREFRR